MTAPPYPLALSTALRRLSKLEREMEMLKHKIAANRGRYAIKILDDETVGLVSEPGLPLYSFPIPDDLAGFQLGRADAGISTVGSTDVQVELTNRSQGDALLTSTPINIAAGQLYSDGTAVCDYTETMIEGDCIDVWMLAHGTTAKGLALNLRFNWPVLPPGEMPA